MSASRKSFNLSLQKKRNQIVLNPIIQRCDQDGSYVADKVVDYVEKALHIERSVGLSKALNTYGLIKNTLASQYTPDSPEFEQRVEEVMRSIILVDGDRLAQFLSDPNDYSSDGRDIPASISRPVARQTRPAETESPAPQRNTAATAVVEPETDVSEEELAYQREVEERRLKKEQRDKQKAEEKRREQESLPVEDDEDEDDERIVLNQDALHNF